jgi:hypothetical protein
MTRTYLMATLLLAYLLTGCATLPSPAEHTSPTPTMHYEKPTPQKKAAFKKTMIKVALSTQDDPKYRKLALDTPEKKSWFKNLMYRLWDRQITRAQFIREGLKKYPDRAYEFNYIANSFQRYS